jgi:hypothetical protein
MRGGGEVEQRNERSNDWAEEEKGEGRRVIPHVDGHVQVMSCFLRA